MNAVAAARRIIYPHICAVCRFAAPAGPGQACDGCQPQLRCVPAPHCPACGGPLDGALDVCVECSGVNRPWDFACTALDYSGVVRQVIQRYKYRGDISLLPILAGAALESWTGHNEARPPIDLVTAVPMHWFKLLRRGYDQSQLLAVQLAADLAIPFRAVLKRRRWTQAQVSLDRRARRRNLKSAFAVRDRFNLAGKRILLIDDVMTTGSTLSACTKVLRQGGAASVDVLTLARG